MDLVENAQFLLKLKSWSSKKFSVLTEAEVLLRVLGLALCHYEENEMSMIGVLGLAPCHCSGKIAGTFSQHLGWVFVGPCHPSAHGPPAGIKADAWQPGFHFASRMLFCEGLF